MSDWPDSFKPREWQKMTLPVVNNFLSQEKHVALEVPTGSGKTPFALQVAREFDGQVLFLTRTKDQFTRIWEDNEKWFKMPLIYLMGKKTLCARPELWDKTDDDEDTDSEEIKNPCNICVLRKLKRKIDCNAMKSPDAFVSSVVKRAQDGYKSDISNGRIVQDELADTEETLSEDVPEDRFEGFCPYYSVRNSMQDAKLVLGTYNYAINPSIRKNVFGNDEIGLTSQENSSSGEYYSAGGIVQELQNYGKDFSERFKLIIIDEAHNLDSAIENLGQKLSVDTINKAFKSLFGETEILSEENAEKLENQSGAEGVSVFLWKLYQSILRGKIKLDDHLKRFELTDDLIVSYEKAKKPLEVLSGREKEPEKGELQYPKVASVRNFMSKFASKNKDGSYGVYLETYKKKNGTESRRLRIMFFDHSSYLSFLKYSKVLFLSATMPSWDHISFIWNLPDTEYINPQQSGLIDNHGKVRFHSDSTLSTEGLHNAPYEDKYDAVLKYVEKVKSIATGAEKSVLVAFTNGSIRKLFFEISDTDKFMKPLILSPTGKMKASFVRSQLKQGSKVVLAVHHDSLLEGVEFLDTTNKNLLSDVVIAGVPIPPNDDYRKDFSNFILKTEAGRHISKEDLLYNEPALSAVKQAIGRATRSPEDFTRVWLLDYRFQKQFWKRNLWENEA